MGAIHEELAAFARRVDSRFERERRELQDALRRLTLIEQSLGRHLPNLWGQPTNPAAGVFGRSESLWAEITGHNATVGAYTAKRLVVTGFGEVADDADDADDIFVSTIDGSALSIGQKVRVVWDGRDASTGDNYYHVLHQALGDTFWAKIESGSYPDARYSFVEQTVSVDENAKLTFADKPSGRSGTCTNVDEIGIGSSGAGVHGILQKPSRVSTAPARYVRMNVALDADGDTFYWFSAPPFCYVEATYWYDVRCLTDGCPGDDSKWFKGVLPMAVLDDDEPPGGCT